ncbi:MAG: ATP-dependent helicase HrpB [Hyphomonadaceae bacterium]
MLPVDAVLPELLAALAARREAVLVAPPGAGKTTRAPLALMEAPWAAGRKTLLLAPRRIAARAAAARMAASLGERVGETIGFRVRLETRVSAKTRIEVITEGVFTRTILSDPALDGVSSVIFDEFHERSLEGDLGLALARDAQRGLRDDLRLLVMSATIDAARISKVLDDAPVIESRGRMFPVSLVHRPRDASKRLEEDVAAASRAMLMAEAGSQLIFLPGAREIERTAALLNESVHDRNVDVRPLYGAMEGAAQDAAIAPSPPGRRKIVLATSIAETSLTIEGVRVVIDSGLSRRPRYEPGLGLTRLETVRASQASVEQRRGRAGRLEAGVCVRLWSEGETRALPPADRPEILDADLSSLALDLASWGVGEPTSLTWLDPPPRAAWSEAIALLASLGALDADGRLTPHGGALAGLPLPPRMARMVLAAAPEARADAARIAVLLTEQGLGGRDADLRERLRRFAQERSPRANAARGLAQRIARLADAAGDGSDPERAGALLALAYPDRVAKARGADGAFLMANGRAASLDAIDVLSREPYLAIAEIAGRADRSQILLAAPIAREEIETLFANEISESAEMFFDADSGAVRARRSRRYGRLVLSEGPVERVSAAEIEAALLEKVREEGVAFLPWSDADRQLRARVALLRGLNGEAFPDWSDEALHASLDAWLPGAVGGVSRLDDLAHGKLSRALELTLTHQQRRALGELAPVRFETPAGGSALIDYEAENGPAIDVRLQELFGMSAHPTVAGGRAPLLIRLLSPAHRPVQTTRDLPGFWKGSYAAVRAEMRGRYPKHPWPEDPLAAPPTRKAKPRS